MAATTAVYRYTGAGPTGTDLTNGESGNLRYQTSDGFDGQDTTYPLVKPSAGTNYSYVAWVALYVSSAPTGSITNIKWYTDGGGFGTGLTLKGIMTNTYAQATGTQGTSGDLSATVYTSGTDMFTYTSASPLTVTSNATTGTGRYSYYVASQLALATSVSAGTLTAETCTFRFDET
jgi:hypothetical protein